MYTSICRAIIHIQTQSSILSKCKMKVLKLLSVYTLVLLGIVSANWEGEESLRDQQLQGPIEALINTTLNQVIKSLPDPLIIPAIDLKFANQTLVDGYFKATDLKVSGIHKIVASKIKAIVIGKTAANITIEASDIHLDFDYDTDLTLVGILPLYGAGSNHILLQNLRLDLFTWLQVFGGLKIKELNTTMTMEALLFDLHGLIHNEDFSKLVNAMLDDNVALFLNQYSDLVSGYVSPVLKEVLNALFSKKKKKNATLAGLEGYDIPEYDFE